MAHDYEYEIAYGKLNPANCPEPVESPSTPEQDIRSAAAKLAFDVGPKAELLRVQYREAVMWAYQLAGAAGCPIEALDNLSALSQGEIPPHEWPYPAMPIADPRLAELLAAAREVAGDDPEFFHSLGIQRQADRLRAAVAAFEEGK